MLYDVFFILRGAEGTTIEAPAKNNPLDDRDKPDGLKNLLLDLAESLIDNEYVRTVGVSIIPHEKQK